MQTKDEHSFSFLLPDVHGFGTPLTLVFEGRYLSPPEHDLAWAKSGDAARRC